MDDATSPPAAMLHHPQQHGEYDYHPHNGHLFQHGRGRGRERGGHGGGRGRGRGGHREGREIGGSRPASGDAESQQQHTKPKRQRLQRPKVQMMPRTLADLLDEPKIALMHRVVKLAGPDTAWTALLETLTIEEHGGLEVNVDACGRPQHMMQSQSHQPRRRTKGGIFLSMIKTHVTKDVYKQIFEVEDELKKKRKRQMRQVKHQKMESKINGLPLMELSISGSWQTPATAAQEREEGEEGEIDEDDVAMDGA